MGPGGQPGQSLRAWGTRRVVFIPRRAAGSSPLGAAPSASAAITCLAAACYRPHPTPPAGPPHLHARPPTPRVSRAGRHGGEAGRSGGRGDRRDALARDPQSSIAQARPAARR